MFHILAIPFPRLLVLLALTCANGLAQFDAATAASGAQWKVDATNAPGSFPLMDGKRATPVWVDTNDHSVVRIVAGFFADDVERVTGLKPIVTGNTAGLSGDAVIVGTVGHSALINRLIAEKRLDVSGILGRWEHFQLAIVADPLPGIKRALVIVGSDRRGTAFGLLTLSETIGVSPWYWWADVTPPKKSALHLTLPAPFSDGPDVRYRGIFLNDERMGGLAIWAAKKIDTDLDNMGPRTYRHIFELLLRLRANYLWPAMHPGTRAFNHFPENARLADDHAIVMGSSHCEIMLRNNEDEWKRPGTWGDYNYRTNRATMIRYWEERAKANGAFENTYTIGLRGLHDYAMKGAKNDAERLELTRLALADQRALLAKYVNADLGQVPQVFCAYKEVLATYKAGLELAPEVTLLWADDNHGFIRNLANPEEQKRPGGSGVYYHLSYYGDPESYLWISSISPALIASEMAKALAYGADRIWVFNVGDIKPAEKELTFAMEMAWDTKRWTPANAATFIRDWAARTFGPESADKIAAIQTEYYRLAAATKPEQTWLVDFASAELEMRLAAYRAMADRAAALAPRIPANMQDAYFQLILYPAVGASRLNELHLLSRRSLQRAEHGDDGALADATTARNAQTEIELLTKRYTEQIAGGKWGGIIHWAPGQKKESPSFQNIPRATPEILATAKSAPAAVTFAATAARDVTAPLQLTAGGLRNTAPKQATADTGGAARFTWQSERAGRADVWFQATTPITWQSFKPEQNSFWFLRANGAVPVVAAVTPLGNIWHALAIGPLWSRVATIDVRAGENELVLAQRGPQAVLHAIHVGLVPPPPADPLLVVSAAAFTSQRDTAAARIVVWDGLATAGRGVSLQPFTAPSLTDKDLAAAPFVDFQLELPAIAKTLEFRALPTQRIHEGRGLRFAVSINGAEPTVINLQADEFSAEWQQNVLRGYASRTLPCTAHAGQTVTLRIHLLDPGVVLDSLVVR